MKRSATTILLVFLALCLLAAGLSFWLSANALCLSHYEVKTPKLREAIRIVQLSDLHNSEFGTQNTKLVRKVLEQEPDLVLITGDLLNQYEERTDIAETLIAELSSAVPVYVSFGNHELAYEKRYSADLREAYTAAGAVVLDGDWIDLSVNGQEIRIGGIYGYCVPDRYLENGSAQRRESAFLHEFLETGRYRILLAHMPACWIVNRGIDDWDADCVFSGHVHGGQVRFPLIGGLWAPDQGWFPGRESGLYWSKGGERVLVLSRGLGSTEKLPRFNNIPEILVADLVPG